MKHALFEILVVDDDRNHRAMLGDLLAEWGYSVRQAESGEACLALCREQSFDLVLMDVRIKGMSGIEATRAIKAYNPAIPVLIMTAYSDVESAVCALKAGACDYLTKPLAFDALKQLLCSLLDDTIQPETGLRENLGHNGLGNIIGKSPAMQKIFAMVTAIAPSEATVLISGASGTGKECIAKLIHELSPRARKPYVAVNCAALTESLLESELFGHEKGAFTGAQKRRQGRFLAANTGTIFLDEVGEIPLSMQAKLLRVLQERELERVGADHAVSIDVRVIAATNRNLINEVAEGRFREDLFYRLNVVALQLPLLRERVEDIPLLATHFLRIYAERNKKQVKGFSPRVMERFLKYPWPGNVRELENTVERAVVLLVGNAIGEKELPPQFFERVGDNTTHPDFASMTLEEIERMAVQDMLDQVGGNKSEAARRLGINRKTLQAKLDGK